MVIAAGDDAINRGDDPGRVREDLGIGLVRFGNPDLGPSFVHLGSGRFQLGLGGLDVGPGDGELGRLREEGLFRGLQPLIFFIEQSALQRFPIGEVFEPFPLHLATKPERLATLELRGGDIHFRPFRSQGRFGDPDGNSNPMGPRLGQLDHRLALPQFGTKLGGVDHGHHLSFPNPIADVDREAPQLAGNLGI